jgi:hypothetical protein
MCVMRTVPAVALLIIVTACTSWHAESVSPQELIDARHPSRVRVTLVSGDRLVVRSPRIVVDTLLGFGVRKGLLWWLLGREGRGTAVALPLSRVHGIAVRRFSVLKTGAFVGGSFAVAMAIGNALGDCISFCQQSTPPQP